MVDHTSTCYLGGGGSEFDESQLWDQLLDNPSQQTITIWPWAQLPPAWPALQAWVTSAAANWGIPSERVSLGIEPPHFGLDKANVLVIPGGNTFELLDFMRQSSPNPPLDALRKAHGEAELRMYGGSAGSLVLGADISIIDSTIGGLDDNTIGMTDTRAADLLSGWSVYPHFEGGFDGRVGHLCRNWSAEKGIKVMGIPEKCGVTVSGSKATNAGPEQVYCFTPGGHETLVAAGQTWSLL